MTEKFDDRPESVHKDLKFALGITGVLITIFATMVYLKSSTAYRKHAENMQIYNQNIISLSTNNTIENVLKIDESSRRAFNALYNRLEVKYTRGIHANDVPLVMEYIDLTDMYLKELSVKNEKLSPSLIESCKQHAHNRLEMLTNIVEKGVYDSSLKKKLIGKTY